MTRRLAPSVNAGSMADIAFLLLIFFLVSTKMETDYGIIRKLPPPADDSPTETVIKEKNLFKVELNQLNELSVEVTVMGISALKNAADWHFWIMKEDLVNWLVAIAKENMISHPLIIRVRRLYLLPIMS